MLRLTILLCIALFVTLQIGGRDHGQLRPGLAEAQAEARQDQERAAAVALADASPEPVADLVQAAFTPEEVVPPAVTAEEPTGLALPLREAEPAEEAVTVEAEPAPVEEPLAEVAAEPSAGAPQVWYVTASSVNVRQGPGTEFDVLGKLANGDQATVVWTDDTGWARIRIEGDGIEGYVSTDYLSATAP